MALKRQALRLEGPAAGAQFEERSDGRDRLRLMLNRPARCTKIPECRP